MIRTLVKDNSISGVPGTNSDVELEIIGDRGTSGTLKVTDQLKTGENQTFSFDNVKDVGELKELRVKLLGNDGWWLQSISLTNVETEKEYTFPFNSLLDGDRHGTPNEVFIPKQGETRRAGG